MRWVSSVGIGQVAHGAVFRCVRRLKAEGEGIVIPRLQLHFGKVDAAAVDARRRPRLEAPQPQPQPRKRIRKRSGGVHPVGAGVFDTLAHDRSARADTSRVQITAARTP